MQDKMATMTRQTMSIPSVQPSRRMFLRRAAHLAVAGAALPLASQSALASLPNARSLALDHTQASALPWCTPWVISMCRRL